MDSMKKIIGTICMLGLLFIQAQTQDASFTVELSYDTVYIGNPIKLQFNLINISGDFTPPNLQGLYLLSGPNMSSSYSLVNGQSTSEKAYSYLIMPQERGNYNIPPAKLQIKDGSIQTEIVSFVVVDNPSNIKQDPETMQFFPFLKDEKANNKTAPSKKKPSRPLKKT